MRDRIGDAGSAVAGIKKLEGAVVVAVAIDGVTAGFLILADEIRAEVPRALQQFGRLASLASCWRPATARTLPGPSGHD